MTTSGEVCVFRWVDTGIKIVMDRFAEDHRNKTTTAEIVVSLDPEVFPEATGTHLHLARLNLLSTQSKKSLANDLSSRRNSVDWAAAIEQASVKAVLHHREGSPIISVGQNAIETDHRWQLYPFLRYLQPTVMYGPGGLGKSFLAVFCSVLVQTGVEFAGLKPLQGNVLYIDYEDVGDELNERVRALAMGIGGVTDGVEFKYRSSHDVLYHDIDPLRRAVAENNISLVVVDSLGGAAAGQINDADVNIKVFNALRSLNVTALIIDHVSKDGSTDRGPIGSVFKYNRARSVWEVKKSQQVGETGSKVGLYHRKANSGKLQKPLGFSLEFIGEPAEVVTVNEARVEDVPELEEGLSWPDRIDNAIATNGGMETNQLIEYFGDKHSGTIRTNLTRSRKFVQVEGRWQRAAKT